MSDENVFAKAIIEELKNGMFEYIDNNYMAQNWVIKCVLDNLDTPLEIGGLIKFPVDDVFSSNFFQTFYSTKKINISNWLAEWYGKKIKDGFKLCKTQDPINAGAFNYSLVKN